MGHDETPFRLELKDPRCGSQIKHKSNPNYEQVLFIKSHYCVSRWLRLRLLSRGTRSARLSSFSETPHFCCLHTSLQAEICFFPPPMFLFQTLAVQKRRSLEAFPWTAGWNVTLCHNIPRWHLCVYPLNAALWKAGSLSSHVYAERQPAPLRSRIGLY